ncbi:hypothetical protein B0H66DRAFT_591454 [Apodospora peruviana]|uniref:Tyrosinase copper-binding domain-containing protein n=1 Tax=Apodospora peruviana TaxID=516989 RepID=A0AAE0I6Z2_9PEZI|nr:hypothetical protein B0H66DRAFT_591454 [Apodospora peruviana]
MINKLHRLLALVAVFSSLAETVYGNPVEVRGGKTKCKRPAKRQAWHTLNNSQKKAYLNAEVCVMKTPAQIQLPGVRTAYDVLVSIHQLHALTIHSTGVFLPWHRWYLDLHESLLRSCGYSGATPYWDEAKDGKLAEIKKSAVFAPNTKLSFGSEGSVAPNFCLTDGPFVGYQNSVGPWWKLTDQCIGRTFMGNPLRENNASTVAAGCMNLKTYAEAWECIYLIPHVTGHIAISSLRGDASTSPSDPVFWLHHAYVDKLWFDWQEKDPKNRNLAVGGPNKQDPAVGFIEIPGDAEWERINLFQSEPTAAQKALIPAGDEGDGGNVTTLNHIFTSYGLVPDVRLREYMDTRAGGLCYEYV